MSQGTPNDKREPVVVDEEEQLVKRDFTSMNDATCDREGTSGKVNRQGKFLARILTTCLERRGVVFGFLAGVIIGLQVSSVKAAEFLSPFEIMFYRSFALLVPIIFISWEKSRSYDLMDAIFSISYGTLSTAGVLLVYVAVGLARVGNVASIHTNLPIPSSILSFLILREPIGLYDITLFIVNSLGIVLVSKPPFLFGQQGDVTSTANDEFLGAVIAFVALMLISSSTIFSRKLAYRGTSDPALLTVFPGMAGIVITGVILFLTPEWDSPSSFKEWALLLVVVTCSLLANLFLVTGLKTESVITVSVLVTTGAPTSFLVGAFVFHEIPDLVSILGVILILVSTLGCLFKSRE